MNKQDIHLLYQYNRWAKARILGAAAKIRLPNSAVSIRSGKTYSTPPEKLRFSLERVS